MSGARLLLGVFFVALGTVLAIDHPKWDYAVRWLHAFGTTQEPSEFEFKPADKALSRLFGVLLMLIGLGLVVEALEKAIVH